MANYTRTDDLVLDEELTQVVLYYKEGVLTAVVTVNDDEVQELTVAGQYGNANAVNLVQIRRAVLGNLGYIQE